MPGIKKKIAMYKRMADFSQYTRNCEWKATIGIVKSTLKIPPRHNGIIPIKIKGDTITGHMAYFISSQGSTKGKYPNINIVNDINNTKGKNICQYSCIKLYQQLHHI